MSVESFIDTNVFLYNIDDSDQRKHAIATELIRSALEDGKSCISYQVIQECLSAGLTCNHATSSAFTTASSLPPRSKPAAKRYAHRTTDNKEPIQGLIGQ
jgi:predicted nucleic acid-binding protein